MMLEIMNRREVFVIVLISSSLNLQLTGALEFVNANLTTGIIQNVKDGAKNFIVDFTYKLSPQDKLKHIKFYYKEKSDLHRGFYAAKFKRKDVVINPLLNVSKDSINVTVDEKSVAQFRLKKVIFEKEDGKIYWCVVTLANENSIEGKTTLKVIKPPVFTHQKEENKSVQEGLTLTLQCSATAEPQAIIKWSRTGYDEVLNVRTDGLLEVVNINRNQAGNYTCSASNLAGTISRTTVVKVLYKPEIVGNLSSTMEYSYLDNSEPVRLKCVANGIPKPTYKWINPEAQHDTRSTISVLVIAWPSSTDFGKWKCRSKNGVGSVDHDINLIQITKPDTPTLRLSNLKNPRTALVFIQLPTNTGNSKIEKIHFSYKPKNGTLVPNVLLGNITKYEMTNLTPYSTYTVNVTLENMFLRSDSTSIDVETLEAEPGVPFNVSMDVESSNITVRWQIPREPNGIIRQYEYKFYETDLSPAKNKTFFALPPVTSRMFSALKVYTRYSFTVRAVTAIGPGEWSGVITEFTDPRAPSKPTNVTVSVKKYDEISLKWYPPLDTGGGEITKYGILLKVKSKEFPSKPPEPRQITLNPEQAVGRHYTISGVLPYSTISVSLREGGGDKPIWGPFAGPHVVQMGQGVPEPPLTLKVMNITKDKIHLRWLRPNRVNGILLRFDISFNEKGNPETTERYLTRQLDNRSFFFTLNNLKAETIYQVKVYAKTEVEISSKPSDEVEAKTLAGSGAVLSTVGSDEGGSNVGAVVGGVITVLVLLCVGIILFLYVSRKKKKGSKRPISTSSEVGFIQLSQTDKKVEIICDSKHNVTYISNFTTSNKIERLFPMIRPIKLTSLKDYVTKQHSDHDKGFIDEFKAIKSESDFTFVESMKPENKKKNRYANILAYDHSRVVLNTVEDLDGSDYVNANYIDGYDRKAKFIATQGPVEAAFQDFWRMVWEQKTTVIIMVTNLIEKGRVKCQKYWPNETDDEQVYGDIKVKGLDEMELADYVIRRFSVTKMKDGLEIASRKVEQYQFTSWPDHGVPLFSSQLLQFVKYIRTLQYDCGPIILHCSAGVGRTGTYITLDAMLDQIEKENQIDVFGFVTHIRKQRNFLVQTEPQYIFIYNTLLEHISCGNTEISTADFPTKIKHLNTINPGTTHTYIQEEFDRLSTNIDSSRIQVDAASLPCNISKNRFPDVLPYEFTRVKLWPYPDIDGSDYINASFVDGYQQREAYILTQAPQQNTNQDFWRMMWEYEVFSIVMISSPDERDMRHCYPYWPCNNETANFGLLRVQIASEEEKNGHVKREFRVSNTKNEESRVITHFMYFDWPINGVPDTSTLIEMIGQLQKSQQVTGNSSIVIHCSDGSGRSGTLTALMYCLERLKLEGVVDVFQTVRTMRTQRAKLVQTLEQYQFIYNDIRSFLDCFSDYANFK